ncbi:MAG: type I-E CRISPR-associated protein Cas5/CasD [Burkholderiales bacterium]
MEFLVFQLQAPLSSWGDTAVGEYRGSYEYPGESALIGLLGAALGLRRQHEAAHAALREGYGFAVGMQSGGRLLRDYHTAQVATQMILQEQPHFIRRDELNVPAHKRKDHLKTIPSTRDYRQDAASLIAVRQRANPPHTLHALSDALRQPRFVLYLGRKACPPAAPLHPLVIDAESALDAFQAYRVLLQGQREAHKDKRGRLPLEPIGDVIRLMWSDGVDPGIAADLSTPRKDRLIRRLGWQFGDRTEHVALLQRKD